MYVPFWNKLDYIGIDGYFPLDDAQTPQIDILNKAWSPIVLKLEKFSKKLNKPIIFTEYGYRSIEGAANKQWLIESKPSNIGVNMQAQVNSYTSFYQSLWNQDWFAGGFIWKWYGYSNSGGMNNSDYTPENKPVEKLVLEWYSKE